MMADQTEPRKGDLSGELQDLFNYIQRYNPVEYKLDIKLQPFIPEYVPSLGEVDDQIKVPRPDGQPDFLGLTCTDEPAVNQSDPALLALNLRHKMRMACNQGIKYHEDYKHPLGWVEDPGQQSEKLDRWMDAVAVLHHGETTCSTTFKHVDMDALLQPWSSATADHIAKNDLPSQTQDVDLKTFVCMVCTFVDIPAGLNTVEALHVLFRLYSQFQCKARIQKQDLFDLVDHDDLDGETRLSY